MTPDQFYRAIMTNPLAAKGHLALMRQQGKLREFAEECARTWPGLGQVPMDPEVVLASWYGSRLITEEASEVR